MWFLHVCVCILYIHTFSPSGISLRCSFIIATKRSKFQLFSKAVWSACFNYLPCENSGWLMNIVSEETPLVQCVFCYSYDYLSFLSAAKAIFFCYFKMVELLCFAKYVGVPKLFTNPSTVWTVQLVCVIFNSI